MVSVDVGQLYVNQQQHLRGKTSHMLCMQRSDEVIVQMHKHTHTHTHTHLVFGLAVSLSDVGGYDSLGLFSQSRVRSQLNTHRRHTHCCRHRDYNTHAHTRLCRLTSS